MSLPNQDYFNNTSSPDESNNNGYIFPRRNTSSNLNQTASFQPNHHTFHTTGAFASVTGSSPHHSKKSQSVIVSTGKQPSSNLSSDNSLTDTTFTTVTHSSSYANMMTEIKDRFPEFRNLNNNELELVLRIYT